MNFIVETSARHVHLSQEHLEALFGKDYVLTRKKDLSQPGQYACEERVTVVGPKKELKGVSILGPVRKATQVELSLTDAEVVLTDASGVEASARISDFTTVFPILAVRTDKLDFLFDTCVYKRAFATAAIPAEGFLSQESFDFSRVVGISFVFDGSGQVLLDNIGVGG